MIILRQILRMFLWMVFLTGLVFPLIVTGFAQVFVRKKASGSLILHQGKPIGSQLIAQKFEKDHYFWPRPSAINYNPMPSGGSNLGPTSKKLKQIIEERKIRLTKSNSSSSIPSELLYASGSGVDPHLTAEGAKYQVERISKARGIEAEKIENLIERHTTKRTLGFMGESCVNVLELNLLLDEMKDGR